MIYTQGFPGGSGSKVFACNARDLDLIPGSGRSLGEETSYPPQYSCMENSMDRGDWQATVSIKVTATALGMNSNRRGR